MTMHDFVTDDSVPRTRACVGADRDLDQDQGSGPTALSPNESVIPSSVPRCEELRLSPKFEQLAQDLQEQNNELARDRDLADREVRRLRKEADLLRRELTEVREKDPKSQMIREVLDYWIKALGKTSRTKCPANGARWNKVRARLGDGFTVDQLKAAIDGCAKVPFVGPKGRQAIESPGVKRFDDIELICRDETSVERFIGYAGLRLVDAPGKSEPAGSNIELVPWMTVRRANHKRIARLLKDLFGNGIKDRTMFSDALLYPCPRCQNDPALSVRLYGADSGPIVECWVCGLDERDVLKDLAAMEVAA